MNEINRLRELVQARSVEIDILMEKITEQASYWQGRSESWERDAKVMLEQINTLTKERDEWKDSAINGSNAGYLREQIAKLEADTQEVGSARLYLREKGQLLKRIAELEAENAELQRRIDAIKDRT